MSERTLEQALNRADGLRMIADFREDYSNAGDQDDIVVLADEVLRLREQRNKARELFKITAPDSPDFHQNMKRLRESLRAE